jgi:hypothetical protein
MVGVRVGVGEGTVAVGVSVAVGGGSVLVRVLDGRGWKGVRVLAQVGWRVAVLAACGLVDGSTTVTAEIAAGAKGICTSKKPAQAVRITPKRPRSKTRLIMLFKMDDPLGISFYGSDTTMSM